MYQFIYMYKQFHCTGINIQIIIMTLHASHRSCGALENADFSLLECLIQIPHEVHLYAVWIKRKAKVIRNLDWLVVWLRLDDRGMLRGVGICLRGIGGQEVEIHGTEQVIPHLIILSIHAVLD